MKIQIPTLTDHLVGRPASRVATRQGAAKAPARPETGSAGVPADYADVLEWAAAWVGAHGVTLPPDTPETRTLRNWFCYRHNQYKKGKLKDPLRTELLALGIDFSKYQAPNIGGRDREDDTPYLLKLQEHHRATGRYHPLPDDPPILAWRARLISTFQLGGKSDRHLRVEAACPGLKMGTWTIGDDSPNDDLRWWAAAHAVEALQDRFPCYLGGVHPGLPDDLRSWCLSQTRPGWQRTSSQTGQLIHLGLLPRKDELRRTWLKRSANGLEVGETDTRDITTPWGVLRGLLMLTNGSTLLQQMREMGMRPDDWLAWSALAHDRLDVDTVKPSQVKQARAHLRSPDIPAHSATATALARAAKDLARLARQHGIGQLGLDGAYVTRRPIDL